MTGRQVLTGREIYDQLCSNIVGLADLKIQRLRLILHATEHVRIDVQELDSPGKQGEWRSFYLQARATGCLQSTSGSREQYTFIQELIENFPALIENYIANLRLTADIRGNDIPALWHAEMDIYPSLPLSTRLLQEMYTLCELEDTDTTCRD